MEGFQNFVLFLCILGIVESTDFNFWLGEPTNVELDPEISPERNSRPVQIYTCMANLLCHLGMDAPNFVRVCNDLQAPDNETLQEEKQLFGKLFWKIPDYSNYSNYGNNYGGNYGGNYGNQWIPNWNQLTTVAPEVSAKENKMFDDAREELCEMEPNAQYRYIYEKYYEASTMYEKSDNKSSFHQSYPSFNCTLTVTFDLPLKGECGDRFTYSTRE